MGVRHFIYTHYMFYSAVNNIIDWGKRHGLNIEDY